MTGIVLALLAAAGFGLSDFAGGVSSRRSSAWAVTVAGQVASTLVTLGAMLVVRGTPGVADVVWGLIAGVGNGVGTVYLYRGFATGRIGVVAPLSAVGAAVVPVAVALVLGERPSALVWLGIVAALPGIWLVSREADTSAGPSVATRGAVRDGVLAGLGFGWVFAGLGQVPDSAGLLPVALNQFVAAVVVVGIAVAAGRDWVPRGVALSGGAAAGVLGAVGTFLFVVSAQYGQLTVAAILTALYPGVTILLAALVLSERIHRVHAAGLVLCAVTVACVAAG